MTVRCVRHGVAIACAITLATSCSGNPLRLRLSPARGAGLSMCAGLATTFRFARTTISSAEPVPSGTLTWGGDARYEGLRASNGGDASSFARFFRVPGMAHCGGGPSTDQFDMLTALVEWVENGEAPNSVVAYARGPGNAVGVNPDVPSGWSPDRSRPLCPHPKVVRLKEGATDLETADSFSCR